MLKISPNDEYFYRCSFARSYASGVDPEFFSVIAQGSGHAVSQASSNLVVTTGTTANAETLIRSTRPFAGPLTLREMMILSQRIANNTFAVELTDIIGDGLPFTANSSTSVTVYLPSNLIGTFDATNIGQYMYLGVPTLAGAIPGRYAIASVDTTNNTLTFTVAGWPSSGSGACSLFGWNYHRIVYDGTTATNAKIDAARNGWATGDTTITINTTASPGHVAVLNNEEGVAAWLDGLASSATALGLVIRGSRQQNIPADGTQLFLQFRITNGSTAPASSTTMTVPFVAVEQYNFCTVSLSSIRPQSFNSALPVQFPSAQSVILSGTANSVQGTAAHDAAITGNPVRLGARALTANYAAVSNGDTADIAATLVGAQIVKPYSIPEGDFHYVGTLATTTQTVLKAAAGAGIRNYVTGMELINNAATANVVTIQDGSTTIWQGTLAAAVGDKIIATFPTPLKTTANAALNVTLGSATSVYLNVHGYQAP